MTVKDIMWQVCNDKEITLSEAAENIGISKGSLYNQMKKEDGMRIRLDTLIRYFGSLECEIYISDAVTGVEYILDGEDEEVKLRFAKNRDNSW